MTFPARQRRLLRDEDGDLAVLEGRTIAVLGYGLLGRPLALNLRETGAGTVIVGSDDPPSSAQAVADGFVVESLAEATAAADVALLLVPDEAQPEVMERIAPRLRPCSTLLFASGYALAYDLVSPPPGVNIVLFAPRMSGDPIRARFLAGQGFLSYVGVEQEATPDAWPILLAVAKASGSLRHGALEMTARDEALLDLFVEQAFGPWLGAALLSAFHVGMEAGLPPLGLLLELYMSGEMSETLGQMARDGFLPATKAHGFAAAFGGMTGSLAIDREQMAEQMRTALREIESGEFARALQDEYASGYPCREFLDRMLGEDDVISRTEAAYRRL